MRRLSKQKDSVTSLQSGKCSVCKKGSTTRLVKQAGKKRVQVQQCSNPACRALRRV